MNKKINYYNYFANQPKNYITSIDGGRGKGKTILIVYFLYKNPKLLKLVNFNLKLPNVKDLEIDELLNDNLQYKDRVMIGITESTTLLDNQQTMSNLGRYLSYVSMQSRKIGDKGLDIIIDEQILSTIQQRFLTQCDIFITALGIGEKGFYYNMVISDNGYCSKPQLKYIDFETMYIIKDYYDTKEKIEPINIDNLKVSAMSRTKLKEKVESIVNIILDNKEKYNIKNKVTYPQVNTILLELDEPEALNYYVYGKLNNVLASNK